MSNAVEHVINALEAFRPSPDEAENTSALYEIVESFEQLPDRARAVHAMFGLLERFPDAELGAPGPLVHALESVPGYEVPLRDSLQRFPTPLTVWMLNRILNSSLRPSERETWLNLLLAVQKHPGIGASLERQVRGFLKHQTSKRASAP